MKNKTKELNNIGAAGFLKVKLMRKVKRILFGKSWGKSMDLLDHWIMKKKMLNLFFF